MRSDRASVRGWTDTGFAVLIAYMLFILFSEMAQGRKNRIRCSLSETARGCFSDLFAKLDKFFDIALFAFTFTDPGYHLEHPLGTDPAG
jgi:hypothetical protein